MTERLNLFNSPFLLGFDQFERLLDRAAREGDGGYPPYNIEQVSDQKLRITLAVAGFGPEDLSVEVEDRQLVIRGRAAQEGEARTYLHKGIAARAFQRRFVLADGIEIAGARMAHGLLHVELTRVPAESKTRQVPIANGGEA